MGTRGGEGFCVVEWDSLGRDLGVANDFGLSRGLTRIGERVRFVDERHCDEVASNFF